MANNHVDINTSIPIFKNNSHDAWSTKMKTHHFSWFMRVVGNDSNIIGVLAKVLKDYWKKDAKAPFCVQQAIYETIFLHVEAITISKEA